MKKIVRAEFIFSLLISLFYIKVNAQSPFQKSIEIQPSNIVYSENIQITSDSGYIIGLTSSRGVNNYGIGELIKTDANGNITWSNRIEYLSSMTLRGVTQTNDGGYIATGGKEILSHLGISVYLLKTNSAGSVVWQKTYGDTNNFSHGLAIIQTNDNGFLIGSDEFNSNSDYNSQIIKTDSLGNSQWSVTAKVGTFESLANLPTGYLLAGNLGSYSNTTNIQVMKLSTSGSSVWYKGFTGIQNELRAKILILDDGSYLIGCSTQGYGSGSSDFLIFNLDSMGNVLWSKTYGTTQREVLYSINKTRDHGFILNGTMASPFGGKPDVLLIKTDSLGNILWSETIGQTADTEISSDALQTADNGYILCGRYDENGSAPKEIYLLKTDEMGSGVCYINSANIIVTTPTLTDTTFNNYSAGAPLPDYPVTISYNSQPHTPNIVCLSSNLNSDESNNNSAIFPNPASDILTIKTEITSEIKIQIFTIAGQNLFEKDFSNGLENNLELKCFSPGLYFISILSAGNKYTTKLIIK